MRSSKWYHRIVVHLMSLALINSFTVYRQIGGTGSLLDFQLDVCRCLLKADQLIDVANPVSQSRSLRANQIPVPLRHDRVNHWTKSVKRSIVVSKKYRKKTSWCRNFVERHSFRIVLGKSPKTQRKL